MSSQVAVERQLIAYLFFSKIIHNCQRQFKRIYYANNEKDKRNDLQLRWKWPGFPRYTISLHALNYLTTIWFVYVVLKSLIPGWLASLVEYLRLNGDLPASCILAGRFVLHYEHSYSLIGVLFAASHLVWRLYQALLRPPYQLNYLHFIVQPREDLEQFIKHMSAREQVARRRQLEMERHLTKGSSSSSSSNHLHHNHGRRYVKQSDVLDENLLVELHQTRLNCNNYAGQLSDPCELIGFSNDEVHSMSNHEQFLYRIMCYKVVLGGQRNGTEYNEDEDNEEAEEEEKEEEEGEAEAEEDDDGENEGEEEEVEQSGGDYRRRTEVKVCFKLRPNRSVRAHSEQVHFLALSSIVSSCVFVPLVMVMLPAIALILLLHRRYLNSYHGCDPQLRAAHESGQLGAWSVSLVSPHSNSYHHLYTFLVDFVENIFLWTESGVAVIYVLTFAVLINNDLMIYWSHTHNKIQRTLENVKSRHLWPSSTYLTSNYYYPTMGMDEQLDQELGREQQAIINKYQHQQQQVAGDNSPLELELQIYQLQAEMHDFFQQLLAADLYMSDIITSSLLIWISGMATIVVISVNYYSTSGNADLPILTFCIGSVILACLSSTSFCLLSLQRKLSKSYVLICSLMAHDQSKCKRYFMRILDFYTTKNRTCYTLLRRIPYSTATYISVIGWTVSAYLILDNFFRH